ncbi:diacylglycerol/lipid kinase family protein [Flavimobilis soli]|nr:diacylglycerol kinase family protein [Flavimobilis soli]
MSTMSPWEIVWICLSLVMAATALTVSVLLWRERHHRLHARAQGLPDAAAGDPAATPPPRRVVAFVANPSKPDVASLKEPVLAACRATGLDPLWIETSVEDPGVGQAREAVAQGAEVVIATGGDGTVRAVAEAMVGTGVPMALLPVGTGNLLARNLDIPVTDLDEALTIALDGRDRSIDVGWLEVLDAPAPRDEDDDVAEVGKTHLFTVIGGVGFDAAMVADTNSTLKAKVGWMAYFAAGVRHLHGRRLEASIQLDDEPPVSTRLRTLLVGNCGRLPGGITLIPDAVVDDGILDVAAIDTRGGIAGWAQLFGDVVLQGLGIKPVELPNRIGRIDHTQCRSITARVRGGEQAQVDGDIIGRASAIKAWVEPGALIVRNPRRITIGR